MSLILEALKKLDREKKAPDRGFLVVGAVPWPSPRPRRWMPALLVVAAGAVIGSALWLAWRVRTHEEAPARVAAPPTVGAAGPAAAPGGARVVTAPPTLPPSVEGRAPGPEARPPAELPAAAKVERRGGPSTPAPAEPGAGLLLQAISERDGKPIAVLSGRVVHEGDRFDGVTVVRIGADQVEIEVRGRRRTLHF